MWYRYIRKVNRAVPFGNALTHVASVDVNDAILVTVVSLSFSDHISSTKVKVTVRGAIVVVVVGGTVVVVVAAVVLGVAVVLGATVVVATAVVVGATIVVVVRVGAFTVVVVFTGINTGAATSTVVVGSCTVDVVVERTIVVVVVDTSVVVSIVATEAASLVSSAHARRRKRKPRRIAPRPRKKGRLFSFAHSFKFLTTARRASSALIIALNNVLKTILRMFTVALSWHGVGANTLTVAPAELFAYDG